MISAAFHKKYLSIIILCAILTGITTCISQEEKPPISRDSVIAAARELIGEQHYCALVTVDSSGQPQIRTMNPFPPEDDMTVWIATK